MTLAAAAALALTAAAPPPPGVVAFVRDQHLTRYAIALADLNGDGRPEALVYAVADQQARAQGEQANLCGSGGCDLYVLSLTPAGYRRVTSISITNPPICVLATRSHGWRDLSVLVAGGGVLPGYVTQLRYDGRSYPSNPSLPPATRLRTPSMGRAVIAVMPPVPASP